LGRRRHLLIARQNPLHGRSPRAEKTASDETLHALVHDLRIVPWLHGRRGWRNMSSPAVRMWDQGTLALAATAAETKMVRSRLTCRIGRANTWFYREAWNEERTAHPDPRACRVPSSCLLMGRVHVTSGEPIEEHAGQQFASPSGPWAASGKKGYGAVNTPMAHCGLGVRRLAHRRVR
jgi:hypothetical protein